MTELEIKPKLSDPYVRQRSIQPDVNTYDEFLDHLYGDLDFIIDHIYMYKNIYSEGMKNSSKKGEDLINVTIANMLVCRGYDATHATNINGHADIVVKLPYTPYLWIGESKINKGSQYTHKGFKQLLYRYSMGTDNKTAGGVLIYITKTKKGQKTIMDEWKKVLQGEDIPAEEGVEPLDPEKDANILSADQYVEQPVLRFADCPRSSLSFYSYHTHPSTEKEYQVRHMYIDFRHEPQD